MKKSQEIISKIKKIIILLMIVIVLIGIYFNIRNSRAEQENEITLLVADSERTNEFQEVNVIATENEEGTYSIELPRTVKNKIVNKYITENNEELILRSKIEIDKEAKDGGGVH